jgi:hypothetical protein
MPCFGIIQTMIQTENNSYQKIQVIFICIIELVKISLASLLSLFVPQNCDGHVCSLQDNFSELSNYNIIVIVTNFILFSLFIFTYIYEIRREYFMIEHFDRDKEVPDDYLIHILDNYPDIYTRLIKFNTYYHNLCIGLYVIFIINWLMSAVLILHYFYLDKNSVICLISNFLLVYTKIHKGYIISRTCKNILSISSFMTDNLIYNIMDAGKYNANKMELILHG